MKIAIVGSRNLQIDSIYDYLPKDIQVTEVISGGAKGIDLCARAFAERHHLRLTEFLPNYDIYRKTPPVFQFKQTEDGYIRTFLS